MLIGTALVVVGVGIGVLLSRTFLTSGSLSLPEVPTSPFPVLRERLDSRILNETIPKRVVLDSILDIPIKNGTPV